MQMIILLQKSLTFFADYKEELMWCRAQFCSSSNTCYWIEKWVLIHQRRLWHQWMRWNWLNDKALSSDNEE